MRRPCACGLLIRLLPPGDHKVLICIFSFALLLSFSDARNPSPDERPNAPMASGDTQGRKTHALISNVVWFVADLAPLALGLTLLVDSLPAPLGVRKEA